MVPQSQIYFARPDSKNLASPMSILNITERVWSRSMSVWPKRASYDPTRSAR